MDLRVEPVFELAPELVPGLVPMPVLELALVVVVLPSWQLAVVEIMLAEALKICLAG